MSENPHISKAVQDKLEKFRGEGRDKPLTMEQVGQLLGVTATRVNKYLRGHGDIDADIARDLEALIEDMIKAERRRVVFDLHPFETNVTKVVGAYLTRIRKTNDVAVISGPAGVGKTVAIGMYVQENPTTIFVTAAKWCGGWHSMVSLVFNAIDTRLWNGRTSRSEFLVDRLAKSNRLILVDGAHRLSRSGRDWFFDFHDRTGCPIAFVGNPEVLTAIRTDDQAFSRVGVRKDVKLDTDEIKSYARSMVDLALPGAGYEMYELAATVAGNAGHLRALRKQLSLTADLLESSRYKGDHCKAFREAHGSLVRDYQLD